MIETDGAKLIFPTSFGYFDPHRPRDGEEVSRGHVPPLRRAIRGAPTKHPKNVGSYFGYIDECEYIAGMVAAGASKSKKLGFVAAKGIPQVLRNINALSMYAQSVDPSVTKPTSSSPNDWSDLAGQGSRGDEHAHQQRAATSSPATSTAPASSSRTAVTRAYVTGYHASQAPLAKDKYLTGAEWDWGKVYTGYVEDFKAGKDIKNMTRGGLKEGIVKMGSHGKDVARVQGRGQEGAA